MECESAVADEVGGKGRNLVAMSSAGLPVPRWFCVTADAFDRHVEELRPELRGVLRGLDFSSMAAVEGASRELASRIQQTALAEPVRAAILREFDKTFAKDAMVAVRSSGLDEDSGSRSFAGQFDSYLFVPRGDLMRRIKDCWASAFSARALVYRKSVGLDFESVRMAVIVQEMVDSSVSGVLFTVDPTGRSDAMVVSAAYGLGEGVVQDLVESDTYHLDRSNGATRRAIAEKQGRVVFDRDAMAGTRVDEVEPELRQRESLDATKIESLRQLGVQVEALYGGPRDVEWAFDRSGALYVLQARPITTKAEARPRRAVAEPELARERAADVLVLDNSNIVESFPGVTLPLTFSFAQRMYCDVFSRMVTGLVVFPRLAEDLEPVLARLLGLLRGHVYYNLDAWYEMLSVFPGGELTREAFENSIGLDAKWRIDRRASSRRRRWLRRHIAPASLLVKFALRRPLVRRLQRHVASTLAEFDDVDMGALSVHELHHQFDRAYRKLVSRWHVNMDSDLITAQLVEMLSRLVRRWDLDRDFPGLENSLLSNAQLASVVPAQSAMALARETVANAALSALWSREEDRAIWKALQEDERFREFRGRVERHLARFGDRGPGDLKFETPTPREAPEQLIAMIRGYRGFAEAWADFASAADESRAAAERHVESRLAGGPRRWLLRALVAQARAGIRDREELRLDRTRVFGLGRRFFRALGRIYADEGVLAAESDVFYLTVEEAWGLAHRSCASQNLAELARHRREEYADFRQLGAPASHLVLRPGHTQVSPCAEGASGADVARGDGPTVLEGVACSPGEVEAPARVVVEPAQEDPIRGEVLVCRMTDPGWVFLMVGSSGIVVEKGSVLSHSAIIGRELGIPTVVGVRNATQLVSNGQRLRVDGSAGTVTIL